MKRGSKNQAVERNSDGGLTLVELMVTMSMVAILGATALSNYQRYRRYVRDTAANLDVRNAMVGLQAVEVAEENSPSFSFSRLGPAEMPNPLSEIKVSSGVQLLVGRLEFGGSFGGNTYQYLYRYAQGYHARGCYYYLHLQYYLTINGNTTELSYNYKLPYWNRPPDCSS